MPINIRPASPADLEAVDAVVQSAYARHVPRMGRPAPMLDDYGQLIARERVHVAEVAGSVQGVLVLIPRSEAMLLDNVAVAPSAQGSGVGRALLDFAESRARDAGYRSIQLYTNELMTENIALYRRIGYVETRRGEENGRRRVYMEKALG